MTQEREKKKILTSFLNICQESEIDNQILSKIAQDCQISESKIELIFEKGIIGIVEFFISDILTKLHKMAESDSDFSSKKVREKICFCLFNFFNIQKDHQKAIKSVKNFYFDLGNLTDLKNGLNPASFAVKSAYDIADKMWIILGDKSTDYNYYTKRLVLGKVISKTFFTFIDDDSKNLAKTAQIIEKEIENVMKFEKFKKNFKDVCGASKEEISGMIFDSENKIKPIDQIVKNLPFIRLFN